MSSSSPLINKNIVKQEAHIYLFTSMVSHRGTPVSFAMRDDGQIYYSVLDTSNSRQKGNSSAGDANNDKIYWSQIGLDGKDASKLQFPTEIVQVGYGIVPNVSIEKFDGNNNKVIKSILNGTPLDKDGKTLSVKEIENRTDYFFSSTARLAAKAPFQALSDGKHIYIFRQSIDKKHPNNVDPAIVDNTLLVDRFVLSGSFLKLSREIRYQRSRHKTEPGSKKIHFLLLILREILSMNQPGNWHLQITL